MRDGIKFSNALRKKIEEYATTEHYAQSKSGKTKLTRTLDLISGTNPRIREQLGINDIPDDSYEALKSVRRVDERIVQGLEIIKTSGAGKLTGHHGTPAAAIGRALASMKPDDQEYVFKSLEDMYVKHGLDPAGILAVDGKDVHINAHGKDYTGQRTGASLIPVPGEKGKDFMKRFSKAYNIQMDFNEQAFDMGLTKDWDAAFEGSADAMGMENTDLNSSTTDAQSRTDATTILKPTADEVKRIVQSNAGNPAQIKAETQRIVSQGLPNLNKTNRARLQRLQSSAPNNRGQSAAIRWGRQNVGAVNAGLIDEAGKFIKNNWKGEALGAGYGLFIDPRNQEAIEKGDVKSVVRNTAVDSAIGGVVNSLSSGLTRIAPQLAPALSQLSVLGPIALLNTALDPGAHGGLTEVQKNNVKALKRGEPGAIFHSQHVPQAYGKSGPTHKNFSMPSSTKPTPKPTPKPQPKPQLTIQQTNNNTVHNSVTKMVDDNMNHLEYLVKNPLSIFGIN